MFQRVIVKIHAGIRINKILLLVFLFFFGGCFSQPKPAQKGPPEVVKSPPFEITNVTVEPRVFNPKMGERIIISYSLSRPGKAILRLFDPRMRLVIDLPCKVKKGPPHLYKIIWDGRDMEGRIVPDEAYFFTIEALDYQGNAAFYDPTTISGGEDVNLEVRFDSKDKKILYELPKDARIMIRAGITGGPLLKTIVNRAPRFAGHNEETWDDMDECGIEHIEYLKGFKLMAEAVTLPENSIFAHGNFDYTFYEYKTKIAPERPKKRERPLLKSKNPLAGLQRKGLREPLLEPEFYIRLPEDTRRTENGLPIVRGKIPLKIILSESLKTMITELRYETIFFVDFRFVTEEEGGYSPFTWMWDTRKISNGEHIVTVNVCTLKGGRSSNSIKVMVEN